TYTSGTILKSPEETDLIYVDETNKNNYNKVFKLILPIHLVVQFDIDGVVKFISEYIDLMLDISIEDLEASLNNRDFLKKMFTAFSEAGKSDDANVISKTAKNYTQDVDNYDGFNLSNFDIDDIQKINLRIGKFEGNV